MKNLIFVILFAFIAFSATPPTYTGAIPEWDAAGAADTLKRASDSLVGATDSSKIFNDYKPDHKWEYVLCFGTATDAGSLDSSKLCVYVRPQDENGTPICTVNVDTIHANAANGDCILLPFGVGNCFGVSYDILVVTYAGNGNRTTFGRVKMFRRRPLIYQKLWM